MIRNLPDREASLIKKEYSRLREGESPHFPTSDLILEFVFTSMGGRANWRLSVGLGGSVAPGKNASIALWGLFLHTGGSLAW